MNFSEFENAVNVARLEASHFAVLSENKEIREKFCMIFDLLSDIKDETENLKDKQFKAERGF